MESFIKLDRKLLQKDSRIRIPKIIKENLKIVEGETYFDIFFDNTTKDIILRLSDVPKKEELK